MRPTGLTREAWRPNPIVEAGCACSGGRIQAAGNSPLEYRQVQIRSRMVIKATSEGSRRSRGAGGISLAGERRNGVFPPDEYRTSEWFSVDTVIIAFATSPRLLQNAGVVDGGAAAPIGLLLCFDRTASQMPCLSAD